MGERRERGSEVQTRVGGESVDRSIKKGRHREPLKKWIYSTYVGGVRAKIVLKGKIANDRGERERRTFLHHLCLSRSPSGGTHPSPINQEGEKSLVVVA